MENETCADREIAGQCDSANFDNKKRENDKLEEMSRKCGSLMQCLHVLQGTVRGLKILNVTSVMIFFLSLIMNFLILIYKLKGLNLKFVL